MDLETATDELYALSPDEFIERRQQLVAEARKAQDRELATQIGKLRRPTRSAWLINLLARQEPDEVTSAPRARHGPAGGTAADGRR